MKRTIFELSKKAFLFALISTVGFGAFAQTGNTDNRASDSTRSSAMHRHFDRQNDRRSSEGKENETDGRRQWAGKRSHIHLTADQRQQAMTIRKDYEAKSALLFQQDKITLKEYKSRLLALQKDRKNKIAALLTPSQKDELADRKKRMAENRQVESVARMERLRLRLNLSDDQVAKLKQGQESLRSQFQTIRHNDDLLPQEKREQLKNLMAQRKDAFKSVLTPDQYAQFEQMRHNRMGGRGRS